MLFASGPALNCRLPLAACRLPLAACRLSNPSSLDCQEKQVVQHSPHAAQRKHRPTFQSPISIIDWWALKVLSIEASASSY
jgi:hypothetical protein